CILRRAFLDDGITPFLERLLGGAPHEIGDRLTFGQNDVTKSSAITIALARHGAGRDLLVGYLIRVLQGGRAGIARRSLEDAQIFDFDDLRKRRAAGCHVSRGLDVDRRAAERAGGQRNRKKKGKTKGSQQRDDAMHKVRSASKNCDTHASNMNSGTPPGTKVKSGRARSPRVMQPATGR